MPRTDHFAERIGAVFLPEADTIQLDDDEPVLVGRSSTALSNATLGNLGITNELAAPWFKFCRTKLKQGCYTASFVPSGTSIFGTRFRGTLRVEHTDNGVRVSGDLYRHRLLDDLIIKEPQVALSAIRVAGDASASGDAVDTGGQIPLYRRRSYHSYLKGTSADLFNIVPRGAECTFTLGFDEFNYTHPATGFSGSFPTTATRSVRWVLKRASTPDLFTGEAFVGSTSIGTASIRWVSDRFRRAHIQLNRLAGAESPPTVGTDTVATIVSSVGWDVTMTDGGAVPLPPALAGININTCWSAANLHTLMASVPGYNPADLDSVWRVHLVAVPATIGCSRGVMFDDPTGGADPNNVRREGAATFSRDGYPANDVPLPGGGSHYDGATGQQQRNVPRAFLRSATHEVGHAFNQIHQGFEGGNDNSIMTPTPGVAATLGVGGTFPDQINLGFNATVTKHLRHLPDPAVRPGAMDFFGSAIAAPEAADVAFLDTAELALELSRDRVRLGEPVDLTFTLSNAGEVPVAMPTNLDTESLTVRINVTDPTGRITFMRPASVASCPHPNIEALTPGTAVSGQTTLFWGRDGFAFEMPGRHVVQALVLWDIAGVPVAASAERDVFVAYPVSDEDNEVAALMLDPDVGAAVAAGEAGGSERAVTRIRAAASASTSHPAVEALGRMKLLPSAGAPRKSPARPRKKARAQPRKRGS